MLSPRRVGSFTSFLAVAALFATNVFAVTVPKSDSDLAAKAFYTRALRPQPWSSSLEQVPGAALENRDAWEHALARVPGRVFIDQSTGNPSVFEGRIEEWIPGAGNSLTMADVGMSGAGPLAQPAFDQVERMARDFLLRNPDLLKVDLALLRVNAAASGDFSNGRLWRVTYDVFVGDVKVEGAFIQFVVNSGNLIQVMTQHLGNLDGFDASPGLDLIQAGDVVSTYIGGFRSDDVIAKPQLAILPATLVSGSPGLGYRLVYHVDFQRNGEDHSWRGTVDAKTGDLLGFVDRNQYAVVDGGVWPVSWRVNGVLQTQQTRPMPFVRTTQCGTTDLAGVFTFCGNANNEVRFDGQYVTIVDTCGAGQMIEVDDVNNDFHLGNNNADVAPGDCYVPPGHSADDTGSAREQYYHVNLIKEKGRRYYPANSWLQGNLTANVNINNTCNAFWNGSTINFYRSGGGCGNTGEEIGVSLHEWGHGFDDNDGFPSADQGTGEAMGDTMGMTQSHDSCIGWGFLGSPCGGYGNACTVCDGVRDVDYGRHVNNGNNAPHAVRDNWNGIAGSGIRDGAGFACANNASYQGPCGTEGHCESYPMSTANWDIANRDLPEQIQPAGPPYNAATMSQAWDIWDRFWWESRLSATSGYQCPGDLENNADGCAAGTYYTIYRAVDDADGNLANGTPHAGSIFNALFRHSIHCGNVGDAANQNNADGCPSMAAPTLTATPGVGVVSLSWTTIASATQYRVLRNELSCSAGFTEIAIVNAPTTTYNDADVANGTTYYYQVVPMANAGACFGTPSACRTAAPTNGPSVAYVSGSAVVLSATGDGDLFPDNCETVTARITILNDGNAAVNNARITNITSPDTAVAITSAFPIVSPGSLAVGATTTLQFTFTVGAGVPKAVAYQSLDFTATLSCDTCAVPTQGVFAFTAEQDSSAPGTQSWNFTGGFQGWTNAPGSGFFLTTKAGSPSGGNVVHGTVSQNTCDVNPGAGNGACDSLRSPVITLSGAGPWNVNLSSWLAHETASTGPGGQSWDRANVHVINVATSVHTLATISAGRGYSAGSADDAGLCHINLQLGWSTCAAAFQAWATSTIDLGAMGYVSGNQVQLELNHNTDGIVTSEGAYFDDVSVTNVTTITADAQSDTCSACSAPTGLTNNTAADTSGCADTGVTVTWTASPTNWGDGGSGTRTYTVLRNGVALAAGGCSGSIAFGTTTCNDNTGVNGTSYTYTVRYNNGCGQNATTAGAAAADNIGVAPTGLTNNTAVDTSGCADTGVTVTWTADATNWGDGGSGTRTYTVLRNGVALAAGGCSGAIAYGTATCNDNTGVNGTSYTYTVRYNNGCGQNATTAGNAAADNIGVAPTGLTNNAAADADACADTGVTVTWTADATNWGDGGSGTRTYTVLRNGVALAAGGCSGAIAYGTTTCNDNTGVNGTSYTYTVRYNNGCALNATTTGAAATDQAGVAPTGLTNNTAADTDACADTGVTVTWTASPTNWGDNGSGTRTYTVLRNGVALAAGGCSGAIAFGTTTCNDNTGVNGTSYTYTVRYNNGCALNATTTGAAAADNAGAAPTGLTNNTAADASGCADTGVNVNWSVDPTNWGDGGSGTRTYTVLRNGVALAAGGCSGAIAYGTATCNDNTGVNGTSYTYTVRYNNGCGQNTTTAGAAAADAAGTAPTGLTNNVAADADACADTGVAVTWTADATNWGDGGSGTRTYTVLRNGVALAAGGCSGAIAYGTTTCNDNTGVNGTSYTYTVRYNNGCGQNATTAGAAATDQVGAAPAGLTNNTAADVNACADTGVSVGWNGDPTTWGDNGSGTRTYTVLRNGVALAAGGCSGAIAYGTTTCNDNTGTNGTSYTYTVRYNNGCALNTTTTGAAAADNNNTPTPTITGPSSNVCPATTVTLMTEASMTGYQWYIGGTIIPGATTRVYVATVSGSYTVSYVSGGCTGTSAPFVVTISPCVPNVVYQSNSALTQVCGDGDAIVEPGEEWSIVVTLANTGNSQATNTAASLTLNGGSVVSATISGNPGAYGTIAPAGTANDTFTFTVSQSAVCVNNITFDVTAISSTEGSYPSAIPAFTVPVGQSSSEVRNQTTTPLTAQNNIVTTTLGVPFTVSAASATSGTVTWTLAGNTNLQNCVEIRLRAPDATETILKAFTVADAGTANVLATYQAKGPGQYTLVLEELTGCSNANRTASLTNTVMTVTSAQCSVSNCGATPGLITGETWGGTKDTWAWAAEANSNGYRVYRGTQADLPNLLNGGLDACERWSGAPITTGPILTEDPSALPGRFYWYITVGTNGPTEGPSGNATAGPRQVNSTGTCP